MLGAAIVYPVAVVVAIVVGWRAATRGLTAWQVAARAVLVLYLGWLVAATLFPLPLGGHLTPAELGPAERPLDRYDAPNLVPLRGERVRRRGVSGRCTSSRGRWRPGPEARRPASAAAP